MGNYQCTRRQETFQFLDLVRFILNILWYVQCSIHKHVSSFLLNNINACVVNIRFICWSWFKNKVQFSIESNAQWSINSLWPIGALCWHITGSTLAQIIIPCLRAPIYYQCQCWCIIIVSENPRHAISHDIPEKRSLKLVLKLLL